MSTSLADGGGLPLRLSWLAGLPIALCMCVMALPELGHGYALEYRTFYTLAFLVWIVPLGLLQRTLWRRDWPARWSIPALLVATYVPSAINNALALAGAVHWRLVPQFELRRVFAGLDGCWLALIAFCAVNALVHHYDALQRSRRRETEARAAAREAELRALQYQLHPHFLFNTLNSISSLVTDGRASDATRMIARLGDLLRATLESSQTPEVTLAEELSLTEHFLDIEKARLGPRLQVTWRVGPGVLQARVPPLLLQPLVENAVRHGIALRPKGGTLSVAMQEEAGVLCIQLHNEGVAPRARPELPSGNVGLSNVRQRLQALYAGDHRFDVVMDDHGNCTVQMELPLRLAVAPTPAQARSA